MFDTGIGVALTLGVLVAYSSYTWSFVVLTTQTLQVFKGLSFLTITLMFLGIVISLSGFGQILRAKRRAAHEYVSPPSVTVLAQVFAERKYNSVLIISAVAYGFFYAAVSSMIIYRPTQNFVQDYFAAVPSVVPIVCCDLPGFIPLFAIYLTEHLGLLIIPANVLIMIAVSSLVGINVALAWYAFTKRPRHVGAYWLSGLGAAVGLFTGCPTCAGLFLGSMIQAAGNVAIASVLAEYQPVFIAMTIPLLLASTYLLIRRLKITLYGSCKVAKISREKVA
jgi:hypothetical protein